MAKYNEYPQISSLIALQLVYAAHHSLIDRDRVTESKYVELISDKISSDQILSNPSKNVILKFLSNPAAGKATLADSIDTDFLDKIVGVLQDTIRKIPLHNKKTPEKIDWEYFSEELFPMPSYFEHLQEKKYRKFLESDEQVLVDGYVKRKMSELGFNPDTQTYALFLWSEEDDSVRRAILQINTKERFASSVRYPNNNPTSSPSLVLRSDLPGGTFTVENSTYSLNLVSENPERRLSGTFKIPFPTSEISPNEMLMGLAAYGTMSFQMPTMLQIVLFRTKSFADAQKLTGGIVPPPIYFELKHKRLEIPGKVFKKYEDLPTSNIFKIVEELKNLKFRVHYFNVHDDFKKIGQYNRGWGFFDEFGNLKLKYPYIKEVLNGSVDNGIYQGIDCFGITLDYKTGQDAFRFRYDLKIKRNKTRELVGLTGCFCGWYGNEPLIGRIYFSKDTTKTLFEDVENNLLTHEVDDPVNIANDETYKEALTELGYFKRDEK